MILIDTLMNELNKVNYPENRLGIFAAEDIAALRSDLSCGWQCYLGWWFFKRGA